MTDNGAVIVIGGSAGSIEPIRSILSAVPPTIAASLFVVVRTSPDSPGYLAQAFSSATKLKLKYAVDFEPIEFGSVYVAPPDRHLISKSGELRVLRGPRENGFRPSVDTLFRTAARAYGKQV